MVAKIIHVGWLYFLLHWLYLQFKINVTFNHKKDKFETLEDLNTLRMRTDIKSNLITQANVVVGLMVVFAIMGIFTV